MKLFLLTLKWFIIYTLGLIALLFGLVSVVWAFKYVFNNYSEDAIKGIFSLVFFLGMLLFWAYSTAVGEIEKQKRESDRVLNSLKKDWD